MARVAVVHEEDFGFQIAPMIDVIFVLMLFFMASAGIQEVEREFRTPLASRDKSGGPVISVFLDISAEGELMIDGTVFDSPADRRVPELRSWLKKSFVELGNNEAVLIIRPSADTRHERLTDVLSAAAEAGVEKLTFN